MKLNIGFFWDTVVEIERVMKCVAIIYLDVDQDGLDLTCMITRETSLVKQAH